MAHPWGPGPARKRRRPEAESSEAGRSDSGRHVLAMWPWSPAVTLNFPFVLLEGVCSTLTRAHNVLTFPRGTPAPASLQACIPALSTNAARSSTPESEPGRPLPREGQREHPPSGWGQQTRATVRDDHCRRLHVQGGGAVEG